MDGSNIYVVWWGYYIEYSEIFFKRSADGGVSWTASKQLTNNAVDSEFPAIAVDGSNVHVVWNQKFVHNYIYYKKGVLD